MKKIIIVFTFIGCIKLFGMDEGLDRFGLMQAQFNTSLARLPEQYNEIDKALLDSLMIVGQNKECDVERLETCLESLSLATTKLYRDTSYFGKDIFGLYAKTVNEMADGVWLELKKPKPNRQIVWNILWAAVKLRNESNDCIIDHFHSLDCNVSPGLFLQDYNSAKKAEVTFNRTNGVLKGLEAFDQVANEKNLSKSALMILEPPVSPDTIERIEQSPLLFGTIKYFSPTNGLVKAKEQGMPASQIIRGAHQAFVDNRAENLKPSIISLLKKHPNLINNSVWLTNRVAQPTVGSLARRFQIKAKKQIHAGMQPRTDAYVYLYGHQLAEFIKQKQKSVYNDQLSHFIAWHFDQHRNENSPNLPLSDEQAEEKLSQVASLVKKIKDTEKKLMSFNNSPSLWERMFNSEQLDKKYVKEKKLEAQLANLKKSYEAALAPESPIYWATSSTRPSENYLDSFIERTIEDSKKELFAEYATKIKKDFYTDFKQFCKVRRNPFFQSVSSDQFAKLFFVAHVESQKPEISQKLTEVRVKKEQAESEFEDATNKKNESKSRCHEAFEKINQAKEAAGSWLPSFLQYESIKNALYKFWGGLRKEKEANNAWRKQKDQEDNWREKYRAKEKARKEFEEVKRLKNKITTLQSIVHQFASPGEVSTGVINGLALYINRSLFMNLLEDSFDVNSENQINEPLFNGEVHTIKGSQQQNAECGYYALSHAEQLIRLNGDEILADSQQIESWKAQIRQLRENSSTDWLDTSELRKLTEPSAGLVTVIGDIYRIKRGAGFDSVDVLQKLSQLQKDLTNKNKVTHIFILGNMQEGRNEHGHWVPFVVHKENGTISYYTANSLGSRKDPVVDKFKELIENTKFSDVIIEEDQNIKIQDYCTTLGWAEKIEEGRYDLQDFDRPQVETLIQEIIDAANNLLILTKRHSVWTTAGFINTKKLINNTLNKIHEANSKDIVVVDKDGREGTHTIALTEDQKKLIREIRNSLLI